MGSSLRRSHRAWLLKVSGVLASCFAAGLVTAGVVSGAGPLAMLSSTEETETSSESTDTTATDTTDTGTTTETTTEPEPPPPPASGTPCAQTGDEVVLTNRSDYDPGATVFMTGTGFAASCDVTISVTRPDGSVVKGDGSFEPGSDVVTTGADGALSYAYVLNGVEGQYRVRVLGADEIVLATATFYDAIGDMQEGGRTTGDAAFSGTCQNPGNARTADNVRALCDDGENVVGSEFGLDSLVPADAVGLSFIVSVEGLVSNNERHRRVPGRPVVWRGVHRQRGDGVDRERSRRLHPVHPLIDQLQHLRTCLDSDRYLRCELPRAGDCGSQRLGRPRPCPSTTSTSPSATTAPGCSTPLSRAASRAVSSPSATLTAESRGQPHERR